MKEDDAVKSAIRHTELKYTRILWHLLFEYVSGFKVWIRIVVMHTMFWSLG